MTMLDGLFWIALGVLAAIGWILATASGEERTSGRRRAPKSAPVPNRAAGSHDPNPNLIHTGT